MSTIEKASVGVHGFDFVNTDDSRNPPSSTSQHILAPLSMEAFIEYLLCVNHLRYKDE